VSSEKRTTVDEERSEEALERPSSRALRASWRWWEVRGAVGAAEEMTERAVSSEETRGSWGEGDEGENGRDEGRSGRELERSDMLGTGAGATDKGSVAAAGDDSENGNCCGSSERLSGDSGCCECSAVV